MQVGKPLPNFTLDSTTAGQVSPQTLRGTRSILFIYPKDDTYG